MTETFQNESPMGKVVKTSWDAKGTGKAERVDPTTEALWEVEWYARRPRFQVPYLMGPFHFQA